MTARGWFDKEAARRALDAKKREAAGAGDLEREIALEGAEEAACSKEKAKGEEVDLDRVNEEALRPAFREALRYLRRLKEKDDAPH